jgi:hypothetical protein
VDNAVASLWPNLFAILRLSTFTYILRELPYLPFIKKALYCGFLNFALFGTISRENTTPTTTIIKGTANGREKHLLLHGALLVCFYCSTVAKREKQHVRLLVRHTHCINNDTGNSVELWKKTN